MKEEQLEFIDVNQEDELNSLLHNNNAYADIAISGNEKGIGDSVVGNWVLKQSKHPVAIFFHLLFKSLAILIYVFGNWITSNFIFIFVLCIILLAFDFWTVKNISGRLLVGLRWWSVVKDDGSNEWIFESLEDMAEISLVDSRIFWGGLYISPLCWSFFFVVGLLRLKLEYLPIVLAAVVLNSANVIGYIKCSSSAKSKMQSMMEQGMAQTTMSAALENSSFRNWILSFLVSLTNGNNTRASGYA